MSRVGVGILRRPDHKGSSCEMLFVGVDVGKRSHAVCFMDAAWQQIARPLRVPHTGAGLRQIQARLHGLSSSAQVIMEASGAHWMGMARRSGAAMTNRVVA